MTHPTEETLSYWTGEWNNWIAPFHKCPRCGTSLDWIQGEDALDRPYIGAKCCGIHFSAILTWGT